MKKQKRKKQSESGISCAVLAAVRGLLFALISSALLTLAAAVFAYSLPDPGGAVMPLGLAALYISAFVGGFAAYKKSRCLALMTGFFFGLAFIGVTLTASLLIPSDMSPGMSGGALFVSRLPIAAASVAGAFAASAEPKKRRKKRR